LTRKGERHRIIPLSPRVVGLGRRGKRHRDFSANFPQEKFNA
jgi:hypothetical protein